jgi:hypothetical protein
LRLHSLGAPVHPTPQKPVNGSLLSMVESRVLMVAEVLRHDQTLTRKPGSRPT